MKNKLLTSKIRIFMLTCMVSVMGIFTNTANASHNAGADLYFTCLGGNQYRVTYVFYRDCSGVSEPGSINTSISSVSCGQNLGLQLIKKPNSATFTNGEIISSTCAGTLSTCQGGSAFGLRKWVYENVVTLPNTCNDWIISYSECCRNNAITTLVGASGESLYTETLLKNNNNLCNNAPTFSNNPIGFACVNQPFNFNQGAVDADGDSLAYELDDPLTAPGTPCTFVAGLSKNNPFSTTVTGPFTLDPITGALSFTPNVSQVGVLAVKVKEFRNGNLIGFVRRDIQIIVSTCGNNNLPSASGFNGGNSYNLNICAGVQTCATINSADADANQNLTMTWNNGIAGATFSTNTAAKPVGTFCWTPTVADIANNPHIFTVTVKDDACPNNGVQVFSYIVNVVDLSLSTSKTNTSCGGNNGSASVTAVPSNGTTYLWSNGKTTANNNNISAGTYTVTVTSSAGCTKTASVVVGNNNQGVNSTGVVTNASSGCNGAIDLSVSNGTAPFTYAWSNGATTQDINSLCAASYTVTVTDANGCTGSSTYTVTGGSGCSLGLSLKGNDEGTCKQGGIIYAYLTGFTGSGSASLYKNNILIKTISIKNDFAFDRLNNGTYVVVVTDAGNGCTSSATTNIGVLGCGAIVDLAVTLIKNTRATVSWRACGATKHTIRYKVNSPNAPFMYRTVNLANQAILKNLTPNTTYSVRVKSQCNPGTAPYSLQELFCTLPCITPKLGTIEDNVAEMVDDNTEEGMNGVFEVMPNPATDIIGITGETSIEGEASIVVSDLMGRVMLVQNAVVEDENFSLSINISALPKGVYTIHIKGIEGIAKRFIKL